MRRLLRLLALFVLVVGSVVVGFGHTATAALSPARSIATIGTAVAEDFDTLATSGTSSTTPSGWGFSETNGDTNLSAADGATASEDTHSYGTSTNTDRAFGSEAGKTAGASPFGDTLGAQFTNNTGQTVGSLTIAYTGEQWRIGDNQGAADSLAFAYSTDATSLAIGTYTAVTALNFTSPITGIAAAGLDGNSAANRTAKSSTITGLQIADGASFFIRWVDQNGHGANKGQDGMGIDDFSLTAHGVKVTGGPSGLTAQTQPTFTFTGDSGGTFKCAFDSGSFAACSSSTSHTPSSPLTDGAHTFRVRLTDGTGTVDLADDTRAFTVDATAPDTSITSSPANPTNSTSASFSFSSTEGSSTFACQLDGSGFSSCSSPKSYSGLSDASHTFDVKATDQAGNTDASPATFTWTIDTSAPDTTIDSSPPDPSNSSSATFNVSSSEANSTFACKLDGGTFASCSSPKTYNSLSDGSHTFQVQATDAAGNTDGSPASYTWTIDATAPDTSITAQPDDPTSSTDASFSFTSSEGGSTFECQLDGAGFTSCTSPQDYSSLTEGSHTFDVRATDPVGNIDASPATFTWAVDVTAPDTTISTKPTDPSNDTDPTFEFSSESGSTFECSLDGAAFSSCSSPQDYSGLSEASHTFAVKATDAAGNVEADAASYNWTIDTTAPGVTIDSDPHNTTPDNTPTFGFSSADGGATFECRVDGADGDYASCSSPTTTPALGDGAHTFFVRATDAAGNTSVDSESLTVDTTPPDTSITDQPADPTNATTASFSFDASEANSTFECSLDGAAFAACTSPLEYTLLAEGAHTFDVRATDAVGNTDPTAANATWTIDTTAPDTTIDSGPSDPTNSTDASVTFSSSEANPTFVCDLDGTGFIPCTSPADYSSLAEGPHAFSVAAADEAGNLDGTAASASWTIDTAAPDTSITANPTDPSNDTTPSFSFESTEANSSFECSLDGGAPETCTSPKEYSSVLEGPHTFDVVATDAAGNADATAASYAWNVDTTQPGVTIDSTPIGITSLTSASFQFSSADAGATFECRLDGDDGDYAPCTSPQGYSSLAEGSHTFHVRATDTAGNTSEATETFTVDTTAPVTSIDSGPDDPTNSTDATFTFSSDEANSTFTCTLDGGTSEPCTSPKGYSALTEGPHTFDVVATDVAGNTDATPASASWTIDTAAPDTSITANPTDPSNDTTPSFSFESTEANSSFECSLDGGAPETCTSPKEYSSVLEGPHTFDVVATDAAGNADATAASYAWNVDTTQPGVTIDSTPIGITSLTSASFQFSSADAGATFECRLDGDDGDYAPCTSPQGYSSLAEGSHTFHVRATDTAGNTSEATETFTVDTTAPDVQIDSGPGFTDDATPSFGFSSSDGTATLECSIDQGIASFAPCTSPHTPGAALPNGDYVFRVKAIDAAGNESSVATRDFTVNTSAGEDLCGHVISRSVKLTEDLACVGDGLIVGRRRITIDLNGHTIGGNFTGTGIKAARALVRIKNSSTTPGSVRDFNVGIDIGGKRSMARNVEVTGNASDGIIVRFGGVVRVIGNNVHDNGADGIHVVGASKARILSNTANANGGHGIHADAAARNTVISTNTANGNTGQGIFVPDADVAGGGNVASGNNGGGTQCTPGGLCT